MNNSKVSIVDNLLNNLYFTIYYMNIIICENKNLIFAITPFIDIDKFIMVSSQINAKILMKKFKVDYLIYEKSAKIDIEFFVKYVKHILSFDEFINIISIEKNKKEKRILDNRKKEHIFDEQLLDNETNNIVNEAVSSTKNSIYSIYSNIKKATPPSINDEVEINIDNEFTKTKHIRNSSLSNNVFIFTSVKGGVGVSSLITDICSIKQKKLILDLSFINGGSDLSYYLSLPQIPHLGNYAMDTPDSLFEYTIKINEYTEILQAPSSDKLYNEITIKNVLNIIQYCDIPIFIDLPIYSKFGDSLFSTAKKIFVVTTATPMEVNRIQTKFKDNKDNVISVISDITTNKKYKTFFNECNLQYITKNELMKQFDKLIL